MEPPAPWQIASDWRERAARIGARLSHRDESIRGVAVAGDYAHGGAWEASLLQIVVFPHSQQARLDEGGISDDDGVPVVVDRITTGLLTELGELLTQEPLAGTLAGLATIRVVDATLVELLPDFRDRYHSADGRAERVRRSLQRARVSLDDYAATERPVLAVEALQDGVAYALGAALGEPADRLRLLRRLRAAGRVLRIDAMHGAVVEAFALGERDVEELWAAVSALDTLARSQLDARMPELGPALVPLIERSLEPARRASSVLEERGDRAGAAWAVLSAAAALDGLIERASPGWRERDDYRPRAAAVYGEPDAERLNAMRRQVRAAIE